MSYAGSGVYRRVDPVACRLVPIAVAVARARETRVRGMSTDVRDARSAVGAQSAGEGVAVAGWLGCADLSSRQECADPTSRQECADPTSRQGGNERGRPLDSAPATQAPHERSEEERSEPRPVERPGAFWAVLAVVVVCSERPGAFKAVWAVVVVCSERPGAFEVFSPSSSRQRESGLELNP